uniref:Malate synthase n=1 Tax=Streptomyces arenae TaxID=29301 RepID=MASY_STRAE|nr:RecName: Full=Malate synthase [Streptomyces arenae]AAB53938.1 malate synthase [Streptomyces arenae]
MSAPAPSPLAIVDAEPLPRQEEVLTDAALAFVAELLHRRFTRAVTNSSPRRADAAREIARTSTLDFLPETAAVRADDSWRVAGPAALNDRRVEITGPTDRKMTINALNSGAKVWLADFEEPSAPTWENVVLGQVNLSDAYTRNIDFTDERTGKTYALRPLKSWRPSSWPRGWHLNERHLVDPDGSFGARRVVVDFGLYFFHNAQRLLDLGKGPYFYLPKTESHLEARLWNDVFVFAQDYVGIPQGTVRATVLIETITAAYEMEEILYELRDHASGLNAGRWDYLFSIVKNFPATRPKFVLPDRNVTMTKLTMTAFMRRYTNCSSYCHNARASAAIGGMAAFIPSRDAEVNKVAFEKVRADKDREANDGFDGSWVAHPDLVPIAMESFDRCWHRPNQKDRLREDVHVEAADLIAVDSLEATTYAGSSSTAVQVGIRYIEAWLRGLGRVAIFNLMEDAATAEISRSQIWQWINAGVEFEHGEKATPIWPRKSRRGRKWRPVREELGEEPFAARDWQHAHDLVVQVSLDEDYADFLTLPAYERLRG